MNKALILFSGGQDSTTCLYWAKAHFEEVSVLNIEYGQRHSIEIEAAIKIAKLANVSYRNFTTDLFRKIGGSALIEEGDISASHKAASNLPASFVPGRNIVFLTIAAAIAYKHQIPNIVTGVCETDYCVSGDTLIETPRNLEKYPLGIPIKDLVGKKFLVWSWDIKNQKTVLRPALNVRKTIEKEQIYEVKWKWGVGKSLTYRTIKVNNSHRFLLTNGEYVQTQSLRTGMALQPFHIAWDQNYRLITDKPGHVYYEHKMIASQLNDLGITCQRDWVGHHKDENPLNNDPDNIIPQSFSEHMAYHTSKTWEKGLMHQNNLFLNNNPMNYEKFRKKVSKKKKQWWDDFSEEEKEKISINARAKAIQQMQKSGYMNPSKLPGVKLKQQYAAYRRYENLEGMKQIEQQAKQQGFSLNHEVVSIKKIGKEDVYDMEVYDTHNFAANGIFIHNSGYPDCRHATISALETTLALGMEYPFKIHVPLMYLSKKETVEMAMKMPGCMEALAYSHTCYEGKIPPCGICPACKLREKGFLEAGASDPLIKRLYVEK